VVTRWERLRRQNHWLDALYNACVAGWLVGVRLVGEAPAKPEPEPDPTPRAPIPEWVRRMGQGTWIDPERTKDWMGPRRW
jgi:hypothetical protein